MSMESAKYELMNAHEVNKIHNVHCPML